MEALSSLGFGPEWGPFGDDLSGWGLDALHLMPSILQSPRTPSPSPPSAEVPRTPSPLNPYDFYDEEELVAPAAQLKDEPEEQPEEPKEEELVEPKTDPDAVPEAGVFYSPSEMVKTGGRRKQRHSVTPSPPKKKNRKGRGKRTTPSALLRRLKTESGFRARNEKTPGPPQQSFIQGHDTYSKLRAMVPVRASSAREAKATLGRLQDQWEKKKKALALVAWNDIAAAAEKLHQVAPGLDAALHSLYSELNLQSMMIRGRQAVKGVEAAAEARQGEHLDATVRWHRDEMRNLFDHAHSNGRLSRATAFDFTEFNRRKDVIKGMYPDYGRAKKGKKMSERDKDIKIVADRWERRKKAIAYQAFMLDLDITFLTLLRTPRLQAHPEFLEFLDLLDSKSMLLRGKCFGKF